MQSKNLNDLFAIQRQLKCAICNIVCLQASADSDLFDAKYIGRALSPIDTELHEIEDVLAQVVDAELEQWKTTKKGALEPRANKEK